MIVARTRSELERGLTALRREGDRQGLVPTMGALHEGHRALSRRAAEHADVVTLSLFVNPTQFGPDEDFGRYPRPLERDLEEAESWGVALVFAPESDAVVYPDGEPRVTVDPGPMGRRLSGGERPGHFRGVLTVVAKLFGLLRPELAVFGRKDFQQCVLIRRMVRDLELGVEVVDVPTVREPDGLAVSSRNAYLSPEERREAVGIHEGLTRALERFREGERDPGILVEAVRESVGKRPLLDLEYAEVVSPTDLEPVDPAREGSVLAVAVRCGGTRLIDNVTMERAGP